MLTYRRLTSLGRDGSLAFLSAIPSAKSLVFKNEEFRIALRRILGLSLIPQGMEGAAVCTCNEPLTNEHLQVCTKSYDVHRRHDMLRDLLADMIRSANISCEVEKEPPTGFGRCRYDLEATKDGRPSTMI